MPSGKLRKRKSQPIGERAPLQESESEERPVQLETVEVPTDGSEDSRRVRSAPSMPKLPRFVFIESGKGGVGKTTIAVGLAQGLAAAGKRVGLLDCDLESPTLSVVGAAEHTSFAKAGEERLVPQAVNGVRIYSFGAQFPDTSHPITFASEMDHRWDIMNCVTAVQWGDIEYLVIDLPPSARLELETLLTIMDGNGRAFLDQRLLGAIVVTEPNEVSIASVHRSVGMLKDLRVPILGIVENKTGDVFGSGAGERLAEITKTSYLGSVPLERSIRQAGDHGVLLPAEHFKMLVAAVQNAPVASVVVPEVRRP